MLSCRALPNEKDASRLPAASPSIAQDCLLTREGRQSSTYLSTVSMSVAQDFSTSPLLDPVPISLSPGSLTKNQMKAFPSLPGVRKSLIFLKK